MNKSLIPNTITCLNLLAGCSGIVFALGGDLQWAAWFVWAAAVLDFMDGFLARALKAKSAMGAQLDSLSDMVSFGVLPSAILFQLMSQVTENPVLPFSAFLLAIFSAIRLAKFNLDNEQSDSFKGLPTPSSAIFVTGLVHFQLFALDSFLILGIITLVLSVLMISNLPLMALKFSNTSWRDNKWRYLFVIGSVLLLIFFKLEGISLVIVFYVLFSLISPQKSSFSEVSED